ncbi:Prenyltransferase/squalene oxidase [Planctopirus limnophila DSM 3776]|uniref:Prenyltransferase/squalene oxidase n=1 Tax=Planctopirus limnophila (strain ATCC 43296 / DSM 3776 / IFAM 1008 / Mu 290) TaxID=521674 RepID=D5SVY3_PLAL2|nr:prenyltransferase/squalene oxidase repeat-containing protein [Planctopirus limnophila]ADG69493.1 Prenyltransferase/squalene oxidase [Planctopirus limnophila DSM 3776]
MSAGYLITLGDDLKRGLATFPLELAQRHARFIESRQQDDGGFGGRVEALDGTPLAADEATSDLYYAAFAVRSLVALGQLSPQVARRAGNWLGQAWSPRLNVIDLVSWLYLSVVLQIEQGIETVTVQAANSTVSSEDVLQAVHRLEELRRPDGGYAKSMEGVSSSTYHSFLAALAYELVGQSPPEIARLMSFVKSRQRDDGGFVEIGPMKRSGTNPTAAAVALLKMYGEITPALKSDVAGFLSDVKASDGGYLANSRIPFPDGLSTFTALVTCRTLDIESPSPWRRVGAFMKSIEVPTGGFLAAGWDREADVEYTFYGLGIRALIGLEAKAAS